MTDLSDFGGGVESTESDSDTTDDGGKSYGDGYSYRNGRCRAIARDGTRCSAPSQFDEDCCATHARDQFVVTIDDDPKEVVEHTAQSVWSNISNETVKRAVHRAAGREISDVAGGEQE